RRHPAIAMTAGTAFLALLLVLMFARQTRLANQRLLEEQRRAGIQEAGLAARSGDIPASEQAIDRAETLHASPGEVRLLRGQLALSQLHYAEAVHHLEQAVRLLPESMAAHSLLALGFIELNARDWEWTDRELRKAASLTPKRSEDL